MPSRFPAIPPSRPSPYRQLGSGGQQPVRVQMIIGLVVGLVLVAVPLYLWRRPEPASDPDAAAMAADGGVATLDGAVSYVPLVDASALSGNVKLSPYKTLKCKDPGPGKTPPERCDHITFFEDALARAIRENTLCGPSTKTGATVSFVMDVSFRRKELKIYRGKSSSLPASRTKELFRCVTRAMPTPEWGSIPHQHSRYVVNLKATYPPNETF
ncbi:MAG: hypothetical protein DRI90_14155 [Deltaproteobacteria bacterium]|nr:MAG: hypothetical protein DRI90_14155 [Deltaproteobacteria bacterium]